MTNRPVLHITSRMRFIVHLRRGELGSLGTDAISVPSPGEGPMGPPPVGRPGRSQWYESRLRSQALLHCANPSAGRLHDAEAAGDRS
jgi:hypothetical protein